MILSESFDSPNDIILSLSSIISCLVVNNVIVSTRQDICHNTSSSCISSCLVIQVIVLNNLTDKMTLRSVTVLDVVCRGCWLLLRWCWYFWVRGAGKRYYGGLTPECWTLHCTQPKTPTALNTSTWDNRRWWSSHFFLLYFGKVTA